MDTGRRPSVDDDVVVLVDQDDVELGVAPKLAVHREGRLHRAVSVVLFDSDGRALLQRRALSKYHSGGLWSNSCCGHPRPGESVIDAARRRLVAELGIEPTELTRVSDFLYYADLRDGQVEHELDHVVVGQWVGSIRPNPDEVAETRWVDPEAMFRELATSPECFTAWTGRVVRRACLSADSPGVMGG